MSAHSLLNLLVIDDDQLYAERLVTMLCAYYDEVNLGFLDDKEELDKALRQQWDVLVFGKAYDMSFTDIVGTLQEQNIDLPMMALESEATIDHNRNEDGLPTVIDESMVKTLVTDEINSVIIAIRLQHEGLRTRRQLKALRHVLSEAEQRANILIKNSKSAVAYIDQGIHIFANEPYLALFGFESLDSLLGISIIDLIAGSNNVKDFKQFLRQFDKGSREQVEFNFESRRMDGSTFEANLQLAAATYEGEPVIQIIIQQNNNTAEIAQRLAQAERQDSLTGLSNRRGFEEHLATIYQQAQQGLLTASLLYVQLDNIGKISSGLGLQGVDATTKQVADKLQQLVDKGYISRFSDTAFTVLVENQSIQAIERLAEQLRTGISDMLIEVEARTTTTTASIGVINIDRHSPPPTDLLDRAVEAINHIRIETANHGDAYHVYDPSTHASSDDKALAESLINAITHNQFELLYQPIYDINTDRSDFFEVYLRLPLTDADNTVLTPDQFMTVAKAHQLHEKIDRWVLINACKQISEIRKVQPDARLLVQLTSGSLIDKKLPQVASQLIKAIGGAKGALTLQFNEQDIANHLSLAKTQFAALKAVDCQLSINNFGTAVKSVEVAEFTQPDMTRLARNYMEDIENTNNLESIKALIAKTNELEVDVLMPYIEGAATMSVAWSVGARYLQGYYLQEPSATIALG